MKLFYSIITRKITLIYKSFLNYLNTLIADRERKTHIENKFNNLNKFFGITRRSVGINDIQSISERKWKIEQQK